jgi:hypothetical protein
MDRATDAWLKKVEGVELEKSRRGLRKLAKLLRMEQKVKELWDYSTVGSPTCGMPGCAMGWLPAIEEFRELGIPVDSVEEPGLAMSKCETAQILRLSHEVFGAIFFGGMGWNAAYRSPKYPARSAYPSEVTPEMVADRIEHWLDTGEIR